MEDLISLVGNVSFPILISVYVLTRLEEKMNKLTESINRLNAIIDKTL